MLSESHDDSPAPPASQANPHQPALPFDKAEFRERLIRGLPIGDRLKSVLLAIDQLCSEHGIREGGIAMVEASIANIRSLMHPPCCRRTLFYELKKARNGCRYVSTDTGRGRRGFYTLDFGPIIDDSRPAEK